MRRKSKIKIQEIDDGEKEVESRIMVVSNIKLNLTKKKQKQEMDDKSKEMV